MIAGCYMPDFCQPMMTGECTNFCPVFCPADQQLCPGLIDENGKMLGQFFCQCMILMQSVTSSGCGSPGWCIGMDEICPSP